MTAAKATACDEEPKTGTAAPFEDVVDGVWLVVPLLALLVVVTERRLLPVPVPVVLETEPVFTVELPGDVVEAGVVPVVLEPIAVVAAVIALASVSLKVPVIPLKLIGEKIFEFIGQRSGEPDCARELGRETFVWELAIHKSDGGEADKTVKSE